MPDAEGQGVRGEPRRGIPFNRPHLTGVELPNIEDAHSRGHLSADGHYSRLASAWLSQHCATPAALLTPSCTAALEMAALLLELQPGDEVIMPSYTFVSTANAFALRGARPVFVDVREDTFNIDEDLIEQAVTQRTQAICVVHYAGVAAEMDAIMAIAQRHGLRVVEDAAQGIMATYRGRPLGGIGDLGALSFHETKNVTCGEGGALLCNTAEWLDRAEIIREKGTDRSQFFRGQVDKYTWRSQGSSFLLSELNAAFLYAQLQAAQEITERRRAIWDAYWGWAAAHERKGSLRRPVVPEHVRHNGHMFHVLLPDAESRGRFILGMKERGIMTVFHYVPLHSSPAGRALGRTHGDLPVTVDVSSRLVRLPLWVGLEPHLDRVIEAADEVLASLT